VEPPARPTEIAIRARCDAGDLDAAMTAAVDGYGDELFGFLVGLTGDHDRAGDVFSATCERMWLALAKFRWESSFRVWMYTIARNEFLRGVTRDRRLVPLSAAPSTQAAIERVRTSTPPHLRTEVKARFAKVREALGAEDHMLLGLRLDRKLPWNDIAKIMGSGKKADLARDAAALRKRFERVKEKLQAVAAEIRGEADE
jgi:RNA polymerase sigma-70 factor (ECF subfamily)